MNNKKRAIMVPVMTLAVCAIAMVGLGFAITTNVTSNTNNIEKLMVDLNSDSSKLGAIVPSTENSSDSALSFTISTFKNGSNITGGEVEKGFAYIKLYGNAATVDLNVTITDNGADTFTKISSITLSVYEKNSFETTGTEATAKGTATINSATKTVLVDNLDKSTNDVFIVAITGINGQAITYTGSTSPGSWTGSASPITSSGISLKYIFEATTA